MATSSDSISLMQTAVECDTCENTARHFCKTCRDQMCDKCKTIHSRSKASYDHEIVLLTFEAISLTDMSPSNQVCKWHSNFKIILGCQACDVPVCEKCLTGEHKGHSVIEINHFFKDKKTKLEEKLPFAQFKLEEYKCRIEDIKRRQKGVQENRDEVKREIVSNLEEMVLSLNTSKEKLLSDVDEKATVNLRLLTSQENALQPIIQRLQEYIINFQCEDLQKRTVFILYALSAELNSANACPVIENPINIEYKKGRRVLDKHYQTFLGRVVRSTIGIKLQTNEKMEVIRVLNLTSKAILSLAYCSNSDAFWISSSVADAYMKYDCDGHLTNKIEVDIQGKLNKPICLLQVNDAKHVVYRKGPCTIFSFKDSPSKLINVAPLLVSCLCTTTDDELLAGLVHPTEDFFVILRFNIIGECKQHITNILKKWADEQIRLGDGTRAHIAENINGDICLSVRSPNTQAAVLIHPNGDHKITYNGTGSSIPKPFKPLGICTDVLGHILIADENNSMIHVLNIEGGFLTMFTIPGEPLTVPISLCSDNKDNLCVGCADGKIRIIKYLG